jgi:hypothetical protein
MISTRHRSRLMPSFASLVTVGALAVACGGTATSVAEPSGDQACTDSARARCGRIQACSAVHLAELYGDEASCESRVKANCLSTLAAPSNGNTPGHVAACADAIGGWSCGDFFLSANPPPACAQPTGPLAAGAACYAAGQCQTGFCAIGASACGACAALPGAGEPCTPTRQCGPGMQCTGDLTCRVPGVEGDACGKSAGCAPGLRCVGGSCAAYASAAARGQPCGVVGGKAVTCTAGDCQIPTGTTAGTCVGRSTEGAACDQTAGPFCEPPAVCVSGTCRIPSCP